MHFFYRITRFVLLGILLLSWDLTAQQSPQNRDEEGDPVIEHFDTKALGFDVTNWSCVRDPRGILWVGNSNGLLEYDGHSWRLLPSTNDTPVYDVVCGEDGTVYFGLRGAFGRVAYNADGSPRMDLLSDRLPADAPLLTEVYSIFVIGTAVYFVSEEAVCRWDGKACSFVRSEHPLGRSFTSRGRLYVNIDSLGLCILQKDHFDPVPGGDIFANRGGVETQLAMPDKIICLYHDEQRRLVVGSRMRGLFRHDGRQFSNIVSFKGISDPLWMPTRAARVAHGMLAVGTTHSGIWIFDSTGSVRRILDRESGINGGTVNDLYIDDDQYIWASFDDGLTRIEWPGEPITRFASARGLHGQVTAIRRFAGTLYVGTTQGLYHLRSHPAYSRRGITDRREFELVPAIRSTVYSLLETDDALLAATTHGVFSMDRSQKLRRISAPGVGARVLHPLHGSRDTIVAGSHRGIYLLMRGQAEWTHRAFSDRGEDFILSIAEAADGTLWAGTAQEGARRIDLHAGAMHVEMQDFGRSAGLPEGPVVPVRVGARTLFLTNDRPFAFDDSRGVFYPDTLFQRSFRTPLQDLPRFLAEDGTGRVWLQFFEGNTVEYAVPRHEGDRLYHMAPFLRMNGDVIAVQAEDDGICWLGTDDAVYRFDSYAPRRAFRLCETLIRRVSVNGVPRYFGGAGAPPDTIAFDHDASIIDIEYASGNICLQDCMLYRCRLDGRDTAWSALSSMHVMRYADLPAGDYVFRVQALIPGQRACDEIRFAFSVLPPWYGRWWVWVIAAAVLILAIISIRLRKSARRRTR